MMDRPPMRLLTSGPHVGVPCGTFLLGWSLEDGDGYRWKIAHCPAPRVPIDRFRGEVAVMVTER